jgi:hypothetical protein
MPKQAQFSFSTYPRNAEAALKLSFTEPLTTDRTQNWEV